jgi:hypothetical protein
VVATYLGNNPGAAPSNVSSVLLAATTQGKVVTSNLKPGTANRLLFSRLLDNSTSASSGQEVQAASGPGN